MISYRPLFRLMKQKKISSYKLIKDKVIDAKTMHNIRLGKGITTYTLEKLCRAYNCTPNDIIEFVDDPVKDDWKNVFEEDNE